MEILVHCFGLTFIFALLVMLWLQKRDKTKSVCIVVLGDIGRSPRMQYHAVSFAKEGYSVELVGYPGSSPLATLESHPHVNIIYLKNPPDLSGLSRFISYAIKVAWQSTNLCYVLFFKCNSSFLILQNPPAIPTMPVCWFYCRVAKVELAIDWHNYAHTIMALSLGDGHFLVYLTAFVESFFGTTATHNFCVTEAMKKDLYNKWNIKAIVLYDRPAEDFHPISLKEKHDLLFKLSNDYKAFQGLDENSTVFTKQLTNGEVVLNDNRPALIVSSTSWTVDEDFSILLNAFDEYEKECEINEIIKFPQIICAITGKGPLKEFYKEIIKRRNWKFITIIMPWLENEDYPKLLGVLND